MKSITEKSIPKHIYIYIYIYIYVQVLNKMKFTLRCAKVNAHFSHEMKRDSVF